MDDPKRIRAGYKTDMLEVSETIIELFRGIGIPLEHCHARPELANTGQLALFRTVFPVDRVAAMVDGSPLIPECFHEQTGTVNAPGIIGARRDIRPAQALCYKNTPVLGVGDRVRQERRKSQ